MERTMSEAIKQEAFINFLKTKKIPYIAHINENIWSGVVRGFMIKKLGNQKGIIMANRIIMSIVNKQKKLGAYKGIWDIQILSTNASGSKLGLFIEMKHGRNKLTDDQKEFKENNPNYAFAVCYESKDAVSAVKEYLNG